MSMPTTITALPASGPAMCSWPPSLELLDRTMIAEWTPTPSISRSLTAGEAAWVRSRLDEVEPFAEAQYDRRTAMMEVARMLAALSTAAITEAQAAARASAYAEALDGIPTWAIVAGRRDWYCGDVDPLENVNLAFPPSPGQLAILARRRWYPVRGEAIRLRRLLIATAPHERPADPAMVKRIQNLVGGA